MAEENNENRGLLDSIINKIVGGGAENQQQNLENNTEENEENEDEGMNIGG